MAQKRKILRPKNYFFILFFITSLYIKNISTHTGIHLMFMIYTQVIFIILLSYMLNINALHIVGLEEKTFKACLLYKSLYM
jgi:hypothetical protein